jgi:hypothetical protein
MRICDSIGMTHIHLANRENNRRANRAARKPLRTVLAAGLFGWRKQDASNEDGPKSGGAPNAPMP